MKVYFLLSIAALVLGILMIILGISFKKKLSSIGIVYIPLCGAVIAVASAIMCLCLGFFMR